MPVSGSNSKLSLNFAGLNSESAVGLNFVAVEENKTYLWDIGGGIAYSNSSGTMGKFSIGLSW